MRHPGYRRVPGPVSYQVPHHINLDANDAAHHGVA